LPLQRQRSFSVAVFVLSAPAILFSGEFRIFPIGESHFIATNYPMKEKATLKQIAAELGVSVSTVSKALNNSAEISEITKKKIREYAELRNYKPNVIGVSLKSRKTKTIGVIIPNILNPFFAKVFSGIEKAADAKGYNLITCISNESLEKEIHTFDMLSNGIIDGFIVSASEGAQKSGQFNHYSAVIDQGMPVVMFDRVIDNLPCDKVIVDDMDSANDAVSHLISLGCRNIGLFSSIDNLSVGQLRARGYEQALSRHGIQVDSNLIVRTSSAEEFDEKATDFFQKHKVDGIFAIDEHASVYAMKHAVQAGYSIPNDLAVIGFADGLWSRRLTPSLSTVSQHGPEIGETAANLLIDRLETKAEKPYQTVVIKTELRKRDSTRR